MIKTPLEIKKEIQHMPDAPEVLLQGDHDYDKSRNPFNLKFDVFPALIAFCKTTEQAQKVVKVALANRQDYKLRVRSGSHDHEGECTATNAIVIDFSKMNNISEKDIDKDKVIRVESGVIFEKIIPLLNRKGLCIPHGTCKTVGVMGFTLGGGWGPWTRLQGMCCEYVVGATIIDAEGNIRKLTHKNAEDLELLWALKGGGGFTFGILTELYIQTFDQPKNTLRFTALWENMPGGRLMPPAIKVLEYWENLIAPDTNKNLIGTNLQIFAIPEDESAEAQSFHKIKFYGYYGTDGDDIIGEFDNDMAKWFPEAMKPVEVVIAQSESTPLPSYSKTADTAFEIINIPKEDYYDFGNWERESSVVAKKVAAKEFVPTALRHFPPDNDDKAPHKLSSKLVVESGLGNEGRMNLITTLRSKHILDEDHSASVHCYVTLGAISGNFYNSNFQPLPAPFGVAFPYQKRPYTIQYQVWWNENDEDREHYDPEKVAQALQWIKEARSFNFPQTKGSFISFKDAEVPIENYFQGNYDQLKRLKKKEDPSNFFGSHTTIKA